MINIRLFAGLLPLLIFLGCNKGPKVISSSTELSNSEQSTGIFDSKVSVPTTASLQDGAESMHSVKVLEVLPTERYVYLNVIENNNEFWIATRKQEVKEGETYLYKGGLLKTNFESKEHNRIFEKIYLVSNIVLDNHGLEHNHPILENPSDSDQKPNTEKKEKIEIAGSISISELLNNKQKYAGKTIQISGECVKINPNIMGRNWIHLKDGSRDDYDIVITTDVNVPEGHIVTFSGIVALDKDFGAGYKYDIIIENGKVIN